jgi:hypothetical protein
MLIPCVVSENKYWRRRKRIIIRRRRRNRVKTICSPNYVWGT